MKKRTNKRALQGRMISYSIVQGCITTLQYLSPQHILVLCIFPYLWVRRRKLPPDKFLRSLATERIGLAPRAISQTDRPAWQSRGGEGFVLAKSMQVLPCLPQSGSFLGTSIGKQDLLLFL